MRNDPTTSIFAENWSLNSDWYTGNPTDYPDVAWTAYGAATYIKGMPQPWSYRKVSTMHACQNNWPPQNAVTGGLENNGSALFWTNGLPIYCGGATTASTTHVPVITEVKFPSAIYGDDKLVDGRVKFRDDDAGVNLAQFDVVTDTCGGCLTPFSFNPAVTPFIEGWFDFNIYCTIKTGFSWTMRVTLKDKDGNVNRESVPEDFSIECKPPPIAR
jgi:hypothetical protein